MTRALAWCVVALAVALFGTLLYHTSDEHGAVIRQHEQARDSLARLAAASHARADSIGADYLRHEINLRAELAQRSSVIIPPRPNLVVTTAVSDSVQVDGVMYPTLRPVTLAIAAMLQRDSALVYGRKVDSLVIVRQASMLALRTQQVAELTAVGRQLIGALNESNAALEVAKAKARRPWLTCGPGGAVTLAGSDLKAGASFSCHFPLVRL